MNRAFLTKLHLALAAFMFPAVLMFLITGALYTWGNKGEWHEEQFQVALEAPLPTDDGELRSMARAVLEDRGLSEPSGKSSVSGEGAELGFNWTGARSDITIEATSNPLVADVKVAEASFHRWLVQLHKAKGSITFKIYATMLATVQFLLVASGLVMGMHSKPMRRLTLTSGLVGMFAFVGFVLAG